MDNNDEKIILKATIFDLKSFYSFLTTNLFVIVICTYLFNIPFNEQLTIFLPIINTINLILLFLQIYAYSEFCIENNTLKIKNIEWFQFKERQIELKEIYDLEFGAPFKGPSNIQIIFYKTQLKKRTLYISFYDGKKAKDFVEKAKILLLNYNKQNPIDLYSEYNGY